MSTTLVVAITPLMNAQKKGNKRKEHNMFNIKKENGKVVIQKSVSPTNFNPKALKQKILDNLEQMAEKSETPTYTKKHGVVMPIVEATHSSDPKVQAILDADNNDTLEREKVMVSYTQLSPAAKRMLKDKALTADNVEYARRFTAIHERAQVYGEQIKLADWDKGIDYVEVRMNNIDAEETVNRKSNAEAEAKINAMVKANQPHVSNNSPVFIVKQNYYVLLDGYVYVQKADDKSPYALAKLGNEPRGSEVVFGSVNNPGLKPADASDYRNILENRPSWSEVCRAYKLCNGAMVRMDFSKSQQLFG